MSTALQPPLVALSFYRMLAKSPCFVFANEGIEEAAVLASRYRSVGYFCMWPARVLLPYRYGLLHGGSLVRRYSRQKHLLFTPPQSFQRHLASMPEMVVRRQNKCVGGHAHQRIHAAFCRHITRPA